MSPRSQRSSPATLLGGVGTVLLSVAAITFVAAGWEAYGEGERLLSLVGASVVVLAITGAVRRLVPATSQGLDVVMAVLVPCDVTAAVLVTGGGWRGATTFGGLAGLIAAEVVRRRGPAWVGDAGTTIAAGTTAVGLAGLSGAPFGAIVGLVGALLASASAWSTGPPGEAMRSRAPALLGLLSLTGIAPATRLFERREFTGMGTLRDIGLIDAPTLPQSIGVALLLVAALALLTTAGSSAVMRRLALLAGLSVAMIASVDVWTRVDPSPSTALLVAAVAVVLVELGLEAGRASSLPAVRLDTADGVAATVLGGFTLVAVDAALRGVGTRAADAGELLGGTAQGRLSWALPSVLLAVAWIVADGRRSARSGRGLQRWLVGSNWTPGLPGTLVAVAAAAVHVLDDRAWAAVVIAAAGWLGVTTLRPFAVSAAVVSWVVAVAFASGPPPLAIGVALVCAAGLGHAASRWRGMGAIEASLLATVLGAVATPIVVVPMESLSLLVRAGIVGAVALGAAAMLDRRHPREADIHRWIALVVPMVAAAHDLWLGAVAAGLVAVVSVAVAVERRRSAYVSTVIATVVLGWWLALAAAGVDSMSPYTIPLVLASTMLMVRTGVPDWFAAPYAVGLASLLSIADRVAQPGSDGAHLLYGGAASLAIAVWGARTSSRPALVAGGTAAVGLSLVDVAITAVGVSAWAWLAIAGMVALTAAGLLEWSQRKAVLSN